MLRAGTYHESVTVPANKTLTVQSYPGEVVWMDGSSAVSDWTRNGNNWVHAGWTAKFDSTPSYTGHVSTAPNWGFVNSAYPMAAHPDQVWVNGTALTQVGSAAEVKAGTFFADYGADKLVVGSDPAGAAVRASDLAVAFTAYSPNSVLRGIGVRRYATPVAQMGAVRLAGPHQTIENVISQENATTGVTVGSVGTTVRNVSTVDNGLLGLHAAYADGLLIANVLADRNNLQHFNQSPVSGGIKVGRTRGLTVRDSEISNNLGYGLWLDESCYSMTVTGNKIDSNTAHGLAVEISSTGIVADNTISGNGEDGMKINNTSDLKVWNNTLLGNALQVAIVEDSRRGADLSMPGHDPRQKQPDPTEPWIIRNIQFENNLVGAPTAGGYELYVRDYTGQFSAAELKPVIDGNRLTKVSSGAEFVWALVGGKLQTYTTVAQFTAATGQGRNNSEQVSSPGLAAQAAGGSPNPLPADVAAAIGQPTGARMLGAF